MRKRVSICFSGHPRSCLDHAASWSRYFAAIRAEFDLAIYFHSWADAGFVQSHDGAYKEGVMEAGSYRRLQELIDFLQPTAYAIESFSADLQVRLRTMRPVILSSWQGGRKNIMSQLYSVHKADLLRRSFEQHTQLTSNVVVRVRFDAPPDRPLINDLRFVIQNPDLDVLIAPSPAWHKHPGGGGGCLACQAFYQACKDNSEFRREIEEFLIGHDYHSNDICDLYAAAQPRIMEVYTDIFNQVDNLFSEVIERSSHLMVEDLQLVPDSECYEDQRIVGMTELVWDIERCPVFVPERLIRLHMANVLVLHGETVVVIQRR